MTVTELAATEIATDLVMPDAATLLSAVSGVAEPEGLSMVRTIRVRPAIGGDWAAPTARTDTGHRQPDSGESIV